MKKSYTIPCSSAFRDAAQALAEKRGVNVGDLARSVMLTVPAETLRAFPDPGDPPAGDRETVTLKSGPSEGRPWRRKPRLQVRLPPDHDVREIRRAIGIALALATGHVKVHLDGIGGRPAPAKAPVAPAPKADTRLRDEVERLRAMIAALSFDPLPGGVQTRGEALHVLGFAPGARPDGATVRARFRMLATIHHPDGEYGSHQRMSQLNAAIDLLRRTGS